MPEEMGDAHHFWRHVQLTVKQGKDNLSIYQLLANKRLGNCFDLKMTNVVVIIIAFSNTAS